MLAEDEDDGGQEFSGAQMKVNVIDGANQSGFKNCSPTVRHGN